MKLDMNVAHYLQMCINVFKWFPLPWLQIKYLDTITILE